MRVHGTKVRVVLCTTHKQLGSDRPLVMRTTLSAVALLAGMFSIFTCAAQHPADNWFFGEHAGVMFGSGVPVAVPGGPINQLEGCASLSDASGNLLCYSDGYNVWDRDHQLMPNGTGLNGHFTSSQSALFTPWPGQDSLFYLFTPPQFVPGETFRYSIVDLTLNGGYGDVVNKNTPLFSPTTEKVTAVHHANNSDIWVIGHSFGNADFLAYLVTSSGIDTVPVISTAGVPHTGSVSNMTGIMKTSPCGDRIALTVSGDNFVELFDFDNASGVVSNANYLGDIPFNFFGLYGVEFSPDGSRLYVTQEGTPGILIQYDLLAGSAAAVVASADSVVTLAGTHLFGALQLAPDGKIYIARLSDDFLSCISDPDQLGTACAFVDTAVVLGPGALCLHGLPSFMSSIFLTQTSICPIATTTSEREAEGLDVLVYPNPVDDIVFVSIPGSSATTRIELMGPLGQIVRTEQWSLRERKELRWDLAGLAHGMYIVVVTDGARRQSKRIAKW